MKQRWRAAVALSEWRAIATAERNRLLGEIEDMQREALSSGQRAEAAAIAAAVDLLDCVAADGALATWDEATGDVEWLIEQVEAVQPRR
jgi:hypothetical protein